MHSKSKNIDLAVFNVKKDLKSVRHWFCRNGLICNTKKSEATIIASGQEPILERATSIQRLWKGVFTSRFIFRLALPAN